MVTRRPRTPGRRRVGALALGTAVLVLVLAGCGSGQDESSNGRIEIIATTNVWASVAQAVGGEKVDVESIISSPNTDPHSYESTPRDAVRIHQADLVVANGGGYDEFVEQVLAEEGSSPVVRAYQGASGHGHGDSHGHGEGAHEHGDSHEHSHSGSEHSHDHSGNEHVWYDPHAVHQTADRIAAELSALRPEQRQYFHTATKRFSGEIKDLEHRVDQLAERHAGKSVIVTEPVAAHLVDQAKLRDVTPQSFVRAVESQNDPAAASVARIQDAINSGTASAVLYNPQTESPITERVRATAEEKGIPVVEMTETLPPRETYQRWMTDQINALDRALSGA